jgi:glucose/arabinose dehydrogenase
MKNSYRFGRTMPTLCRFIAGTCLSIGALLITAAAQQTYNSQLHRFQTETVATGLKQPSAMIFLPDGTALLVERQKGIDRFDPRSNKLTPLEAPDALIGTDTGAHDANRPATLTGEDAGFHDIILHPDYAKNGWIYLTYSDGPRERSTTVVDRFHLRDNKLVDRQRIFTADAWSEDRFHYGGRMAFIDGYLYLTIGDRHHQDRAQELDTHAGKILRLRDDGSAPPDNPFVNTKDAKPEIWSYGHRNEQGLVANPASGELWEHEHGPLHGDELNVIKRGANYGWPIISYGWQYAGGPIGKGITAEKEMEQPIWVWTPGIAPSDMIFYTGTRFPQWRGNIFIGAMAGRNLTRLVIQDGRVVVEERLMNRQSGRVRLVAQSSDGFIYIGNDDGELLRLKPVE